MSILFSHFFDKINKIAPLEGDFTEVLDSIALEPKMLYFYGKLPENVPKNSKSGVQKQRPKTVAIVGARHNTRYGEEVAYRMAYELARQGVVVVSGLAYGIDSIAHRGCLDAGGTTVAVLGTPINEIYPQKHMGLAAEIVEKGGAVMSEYAPNDSQSPILAPGEALLENGRRVVARKAAFLYRNRLIAGLADAVVVVEAARRSGSLNTAAHALTAGRDVFAVPGNITNPYSQGCNRLIAEGAFPYSEPDDILRVLLPEHFAKQCHERQTAHLVGDSDSETAVLQALAKGARRGEDIMKAAILPPEVFNQTITLLEIKSRVRALGANNWALA